MTFQLIGVNHRTAPLEVRERFAISESKLPAAVQQFAQHPGIEEAMIVSTCNRVELLARSRNGGADLRAFLGKYLQVDPRQFDQHLYAMVLAAVAGGVCGYVAHWTRRVAAL